MPVTEETKFGGYAEDIVNNPADYDSLEVHGVSEEEDGYGGTACEIDDENPEFFSVYAHLKQGGVECIGDFRTTEDAIAYAKEIAALHGYDMSA